MIHTIELRTQSRTVLVDITGQVEAVIKQSGIESGIAHIYVPHTTAAVTINENSDPAVGFDITDTLSRLMPAHDEYEHSEGNADAHIKAAIVGSSRTVFIENGKIAFGSWQGIFFCEFDGPRVRKVYVKIVADQKRKGD